MQRLDVYLCEKGYYVNRSQALQAIKQGLVLVNGVQAKKAGQTVDESSKIEVTKPKYEFVSRGGQKLQGALDNFNIDVAGVVALDIGSSTGGFCDCLLQNGAKSVIAVDVGENQLNEKLKKDKRITCFEKTDIRTFDVNSLKQKPTFVCGDLSFISLVNIIPHIAKIKSVKQVVLLIKPQFECGKVVASKYNGVIKDFTEHKKAIIKVLNCLAEFGFGLFNVMPSVIKGGSGNIEYVVQAKIDAEQKDVKGIAEKAIKQAKAMYKKGKE